MEISSARPAAKRFPVLRSLLLSTLLLVIAHAYAGDVDGGIATGDAAVAVGSSPTRDSEARATGALSTPTRVLAYSLSMFGTPPSPSRAYIGKDSLIHALRAEDTRVRYRYTGVKAPQ